MKNLASTSHKYRPMLQNIGAFTLAEVLITLGIIGVVAAMSIPTLLSEINNMQYKAAYKKAYSDLQQGLQNAAREGLLTEVSDPHTGNNNDGGNNANFYQIMQQLKIIKECIAENNGECWDSTGEKFGQNYAGVTGRPAGANSSLNAAIDSSGRAWTTLEWAQGKIAVDINGFKKPNQYGKDRFAFVISSIDNTHTLGIPFKIKPYQNNYAEVCTGNSCGNSASPDYNTYYGTSWLINDK